MNWPTYPGTMPDIPALRRYHERITGAGGPGAPGTYGLAVDAWRIGGTPVHLWRSYDPAAGISAADWAERHLPPDTAWNWDDGTWSAPGVVNVDRWPFPTAAALAGPMSLAAISDTLAALLAIGGWPSREPTGLDTVPSAHTLTMRLARAEAGWIVVRAHGAETSIRALVARMGAAVEPAEPFDPRAPRARWRATLTRRAVRAGATTDVDLPEKAGTFTTSADADTKAVARIGRAICGVTGWPAARVPGTLTWNLARAPYRLTIEPVEPAT